VVADKAVNISSTAAGINASSPTKIVLTAGGAGITISGGNITLAAPGNITFKAGMKNFTGGAGASDSIKLKKASDLFDEQFVMKDQVSQQPVAGAPYRIENAKGQVVASGVTDAQGRTARVTTTSTEKLFVHWGR
jgi:type VI secretion system secreted protein VgrG